MTVTNLWPDDLQRRERELAAGTPRPPSVAQIEATLSRPEFWLGAQKTRKAIDPDGARGWLSVRIGAELLRGASLSEIACYQEWLRGRR